MVTNKVGTGIRGSNGAEIKMDIQSLQYISQLTGMSTYSVGATPTVRFQDELERAAAVQSPQSMDDIFEKASKAYGIPLNLLKAVAKAESDFNPSAVSGCGAIGVMQLMPGTARSLGVDDPYNAEQNIMGGAKYLSQMLDQFDGDTALALAGYNAGPGAVKKYDGIPPYKETQNYVRKVMGLVGEDLGKIGAVPGQTGVKLLGTVDVTPLEELIESLNTPGKTTTPQEAAQLYNVYRSMLHAQMNSALTNAMNGTDTGGLDLMSKLMNQQNQLIAL